MAALLLPGCGGGTKTRSDVATSSTRFDGIPQHGAVLGSPRAPYTMIEFADLQCPYCARFDRDVLPAVIDRFVRPGRLRLQLEPIAVIGPDSIPGAEAAIAAGAQNRMWQFADLVYRNQRPENSGYVTQAFVDRIAGAVPELDVARLNRDMSSTGVRAALVENQRVGRTARVAGTPGFRLGRTGGVLSTFEGRLLTRADFVRRLAAVTAGSR